MKLNIWKSIIAGIGVVLAIFIVGLIGKYETSYELSANVESVKDGITIFADNDGNVWSYETSEFENGETVILVLHDGGTSRVQDDAITEIKLVEE